MVADVTEFAAFRGTRGSVPPVTRVAIVDDHEAIREGLALLLDAAGLDVVGGVGTAAAAPDLVEQERPDVALVAPALPDGSGIELTRELLARHPDVQVLLYAGQADPDLVYAGLDCGARGYALKAGSGRELVEAIARVAAGGRYVDPRLDRVLASGRAVGRARSLSPRERDVLELMAAGHTAETAGVELGIAVETVRTHVRGAIGKLQARNRVHAIALALRSGEIALDEEPD